MKNRKIIASVMAASMLLACAGCSEKNEDKKDRDSNKKAKKEIVNVVEDFFDALIDCDESVIDYTDCDDDDADEILTFLNYGDYLDDDMTALYDAAFDSFSYEVDDDSVEIDDDEAEVRVTFTYFDDSIFDEIMEVYGSLDDACRTVRNGSTADKRYTIELELNDDDEWVIVNAYETIESISELVSFDNCVYVVTPEDTEPLNTEPEETEPEETEPEETEPEETTTTAVSDPTVAPASTGNGIQVTLEGDTYYGICMMSDTYEEIFGDLQGELSVDYVLVLTDDGQFGIYLDVDQVISDVTDYLRANLATMLASSSGVTVEELEEAIAQVGMTMDEYIDTAMDSLTYNDTYESRVGTYTVSGDTITLVSQDNITYICTVNADGSITMVDNSNGMDVIIEFQPA